MTTICRLLTSLILTLIKKNTPGAIRTRDPLLRRQLLYPAELRTHISYINTYAKTETFGFRLQQ